jgi:hypothetical protein
MKLLKFFVQIYALITSIFLSLNVNYSIQINENPSLDIFDSKHV